MYRAVVVSLTMFVASSSFAQTFLPLTMQFDSTPRTLDQVEHLKFNLPVGWENSELGFFYTNSNMSGCSSPQACVGQFEGRVSMGNTRNRMTYRVPRRLLGTGEPSIGTPYYVFGVALNKVTGQIAVSPISTITPRDVLGSVTPAVGAFDDEYIPMPPRDTRTIGDIYVDNTTGSNTNDGRSPSAAVRTIPMALQRLHEAFPTAAQRAGKLIIVRRGTYYYEHSNGVISLPDSPYLYTELNSEGHKMVGVAGNPVKILADPSAQGDVHLVARRLSNNCPTLIGVELAGTANIAIEGFHIGWRPSEPVAASCGLSAPIELINPDNTKGVQILFNKISTHRAKWGTQLFGSCSDFAFIGNESYGLTGEHQLYIGCGPYWDSYSHTLRAPGVKRNFVVAGNTFFGSERWGTQINGNIQDVYIARNTYISNGTGAIKSEGASGVTIVGNEMYGVSTCVSLENYVDSSYYNRGIGDFSNNRGDLAAFQRARQLVNGYATIANNSCYIPNSNFYDNPTLRSGSNPSSMPGITIAEDFKLDSQGNPIGEPHHDIVVANNVISSPDSGVFRYMVSVANTQNPNAGARLERQLESAKVYNNIFFTRSASTARVFTSHWHPTQGNVILDNRSVASMETKYPERWFGNLVSVDPLFTQISVMTGLSDAQMMGLFTEIDNGQAQIPRSNMMPSSQSMAVDSSQPIAFANGSVNEISEDLRTGEREIQGNAADRGAIESPYTRSSFLGSGPISSGIGVSSLLDKSVGSVGLTKEIKRKSKKAKLKAKRLKAKRDRGIL